MKVLTISYSDQAGGAAKAAYRIHQAVQAQGVESTMLVMQKTTNDPSVLALADLLPRNVFYKTAHWIRYKIQNKLQRRRWNKYPNRRKELFMSDLRHDDIRRALRRMNIAQYDVIHLHWCNHRFFDFSVLPEFGKPIILTLHDSWYFCGVCHYFLDCQQYTQHCGNCPQLNSCNEKDLAWQVFEKKKCVYEALPQKKVIVAAPSRWLTSCAAKSALLGRFACVSIPNCVDIERFSIRPNASERSERATAEKRFAKPFVLYGAVNAATDKIKGFANLLSALQILKAQGKTNFELVVFGANQPLHALDEAVPTRYVGYVSNEQELVKLYNEATVMVVPSLTENLSCTIMESLACGTPVVAFNIGGNGDMLIHKENGYLAEKQSDTDLAAGISYCLDHSWNKSAIRQTITTRFTPKIVAKEYIKQYNQAIQ